MNELFSEKSYHPRRIILISSVGVILAFLATWIGCLIAEYFDFDNQLFILFGLFLLCVGIQTPWDILSYYRESITLSETAITHQGVIFKTIIPVENVSHIKWYPELVIESQSANITICLNKYIGSEKIEIIYFLRYLIDEKSQSRWKSFRNSRRRARVPVINSKAGNFISALVLLGFSGVFIYVWTIGLGTNHLVIAVICTLIGLWYVFRFGRLVLKHKTQ